MAADLTLSSLNSCKSYKILRIKDTIAYFEILADSSQLKKHDDIGIDKEFSNLRALPRPLSATSLFAVLQVLESLALDILEYQRVTELTAEKSVE